MIPEEVKKITEDDKLMERFEKDWTSMSNYWEKLHTRHRKDTRFTWFNDQWSEAAKKDRAAQPSGSGTPLPPRPMNVYNISKPFIIKVINGVKKMRPELAVNPVDDETDQILADVHRGILKAIEKNTGAVQSRMQALKDAVGSGFGFYGFYTEWESPMSFNQQIKYRFVEDATTVLWDENSKEPDGSDLMKLQIQEKYSESKFEAEFKIKWKDVWDGGGMDISRAWGNEDGPVVTEYWYIEEKPEVLVSIDGKGRYLKDVEKEIGESGIQIEQILDVDEETGEYIQRKTTSRQVWRCKLAGKKVLKKEKWPGYWIPMFKIDGRKTVCENEVRIDGLTMDVRAPQKSYNYARNNKLERMSLTQKSGVFTPVGGIPKNQIHKYNTANTRNWPRYEFNAYDKQGNPLPAPYRIPPPDMDPSAIQEEQTSAEEIKASLGMFGSYMGDTQGEKSGKAILAGAAESSDITFDFAYNLGLTMNHEGRVAGELVPKVFDTPQQVRMVGEDEKEKVVWVNKKSKDEKGEDYYYDLKSGKYDYHVTMGPSSEDKRGETRLEMEALFGKAPELREILADIFIQQHEWPKADEAAKRAKAFIKKKYPGIIEDEDEEGPSPEMQEAQQMMQEMQQQMQQLVQENEQLKTGKEIEFKKVENDDMNNEEKNEIELSKADTARMKVESDAIAQAAKIETEREKLRLEGLKAERDYQLELARLQDSKESRINESTSEKGKQEVATQYDGMISELKATIESIRSDLSNKEQSLPAINVNIDNKPQDKKDAKIKKDKDGNYTVNYEDDKE